MPSLLRTLLSLSYAIGLIVASSASSIISSSPASSLQIPSVSTVSNVPSSVAFVNGTNASNAAIKAAGGVTVSGKILVFARDSSSAYSAISGLDGYGIPYELVLVPMEGITLPTLNGSSVQGNYGGIIILSEVTYGYDNGADWRSAITDEQWQTIYNYQAAFSIRLVRLDAYPSSDFGVDTAVSGTGCCDSGVEQLISLTDTSAFKTAGLKAGAGVSSQGLYHYPATIINSTLAKEIAQFGAGGVFTNPTTAAVINDFDDRQQMVWFTSWATDWSTTSNFLMHAHIHWMTRGLFIGRRRMYFSTQVDDVHLATYLYDEGTNRFRLRPSDLDAHVTWQAALNARLPAGSNYVIEMGHNGNGAIEWAVDNDQGLCNPDTSTILDPASPDPPLEWMKPLGTGTSLWPTSITSYNWTLDCIRQDTLATWFLNPTNRDNFAHISHTFTHENLNNATYSDTSNQLSYNIAWLKQMGLWDAAHFSPNGLIPPAITGLHNGDAIHAILDNDIKYVVGDNSRPSLLNPDHEFWPLLSSASANGWDGLTIMPRWSTPIYFDCDTQSCTTAEWIAVSSGSGSFADLIAFCEEAFSRVLLGLHWAPFMFHQANMREGDVDSYTVGDQTGALSLLQIWVETVLQEVTRLTSWPVVTLKHDDLALEFAKRQTLDQCSPTLSYQLSTDGKTITSVTVGAKDNTCTTEVPLTLPVPVSGGRQEQIGMDPLTVWTRLEGGAVVYVLGTPVEL